MKKQCKITIHGKVQGVGFRYFIERQARSLGLFGFARNEPDGTVYAEAEGDSDALQKLVELCNQGPSFGSVDSADVSWSDELANYSDFKIQF